MKSVEFSHVCWLRYPVPQGDTAKSAMGVPQPCPRRRPASLSWPYCCSPFFRILLQLCTRKKTEEENSPTRSFRAFSSAVQTMCGTKHRGRASPSLKASVTRASSITATLGCSSTTAQKKAEPLVGPLLQRETSPWTVCSCSTPRVRQRGKPSTETNSTLTSPHRSLKCCKTAQPSMGSTTSLQQRGCPSVFRGAMTKRVLTKNSPCWEAPTTVPLAIITGAPTIMALLLARPWSRSSEASTDSFSSRD